MKSKKGLSKLVWILIILGIIAAGYLVWYYFIRTPPPGGIFVNPS